MHYFVTGATGFIGKRLVKKLLTRKGSLVYFLIRKQSLDKVPALLEYWDVSKTRAIPVFGDLREPELGISTDDVKLLSENIDHFFHLAAVYDLAADADDQIAVNVDGTRKTVAFANAIGALHLHHVSSIAAAGLYEGVFREDMFDEAENFDHPYFSTKHKSEKIVRSESKVPFRIYRPGIVIGDSKTGAMDKIDGPYYFFKLIQRIRQLLPPWMPMIGLEGGRLNIVPVDYVVDALDYIAHQPKLDGHCFHLTDPEAMRVGDVLNTFARAAHAPTMSFRINAALMGFIPESVKKGMMSLTPVRRIKNAVLKDLGLPDDMMQFINYPTRFDNRNTATALAGSGISCPRLENYADKIWDYWERHLDPALLIDRTLRGQVADKVVLVTGGSSGIGLAAAHKLAEAGAITIICGRNEDKLAAAKMEINGCGFDVITYCADLADMENSDRFLKLLLTNHGRVDILVNNAGRSIRRGIESSYDRFHDFERMMQLNYFGALRLTMGLLPKMIEQKHGHVINISSIGVLTNAPRFSGYVASKAALDAWTRCAASEFADVGIKFTTISMPLVRTPMIAPTKIYENMPTLAPEQAAELIIEAIVYKPVRIATRLGVLGEVLHALVPRVAQIVMNTSFRMFPDSDAANAREGENKTQHMNADQMVLQKLLHGVHF
ncbi:MAG: SDR family oxidoreductase [Undibacterium sp.]|uniref:SDR family oxidoreductase n=1 Tax=Undibacterium sp. TaxID=1914977 RepID=UPI00271941A2|nr:SDR family oxidoreductase [Undibacterium sp.]MDO8650611.1 SDR family oxidoreductase [Undibacterium sp.]